MSGSVSAAVFDAIGNSTLGNSALDNSTLSDVAAAATGADRSTKSLSMYVKLIPLALATVSFLVQFCIMSYAWRYRDYPPITVKHVPLMLMVVFSSVFWWMGSWEATLGGSQFPWTDPSSRLFCSLYGVWARLVFGLAPLLLALNLRSIVVYQVCIKKHKAALLRQRFPYYMLLLLPVLAIGIVSIWRPDLFGELDHNGKNLEAELRAQKAYGAKMFGVYDTCVYTPLAVGLSSGVVCIGLVCYAYLTWSLRGIRVSFNEAKSSACILFMLIVTLSTSSWLLATGRNRIWYNALIIQILNLILINVIFWSLMARPIYGCMFKRDEHLREFVVSLELGKLASKLGLDDTTKREKVDRRTMFMATRHDHVMVGAYPEPESEDMFM